MSQTALRTPDHPIDPIFLDRWSTRAFSGETIPDRVLFSAFEAVRWAPSGGNSQPWRLIYVKRDTPHWDGLFGTLFQRNRLWAVRASVLVLFLSNTLRPRIDDQPELLRSHSFDTGAAWSNFAHQLARLDWASRAIGGFDREAVRRLFNIPDYFAVEAVIAVGKPTEASVLPENTAKVDKPNSRLPVKAFVAEGKFTFA